jgi:hypothetical protein
LLTDGDRDDLKSRLISRLEFGVSGRPGRPAGYLVKLVKKYKKIIDIADK